MKTFIFSIHASMMFGPYAERTAFCFLSSFNSVALLFFFPLTFCGPQITSPSPFRIGSARTTTNNWITFLARCPLFTKRLPFVPLTGFGPSRASCFVLSCCPLCLQPDVVVLHRVVLYLSTDFLLFRVLDPGLFQRLCLVVHRGVL